jgi:hypothetical protein
MYSMTKKTFITDLIMDLSEAFKWWLDLEPILDRKSASRRQTL